MAMAMKTWKRAICVETDNSTDTPRFFGSGYTDSQKRLKRPGLTAYALCSRDSRCWTNSEVRVSASKRLGNGVVVIALLRSVKLDRDEPGAGLSVRAAKIPWRGSRGAGASGMTSASSSVPCSSLSKDEDSDVRRDGIALGVGSGFSWPVFP